MMEYINSEFFKDLLTVVKILLLLAYVVLSLALPLFGIDCLVNKIFSEPTKLSNMIRGISCFIWLIIWFIFGLGYIMFTVRSNI